ncbi:helix-turn-helix domain-containing protein [Candidatus Nomurabacteria bacterium]|nr:helix-turn-helix domain-containing protein [Candidatus Nomurabacteria bacterium]
MKPKFQESPNNEIRVIDLSRGDIKSLIAEVLDEKLAQLAGLINSSTSKSGEYWTRKETAKRLSITLPTLRQYTKDGRLISHEISGRVLYKPEEVEKALKAQIKSVRK